MSRFAAARAGVVPIAVVANEEQVPAERLCQQRHAAGRGRHAVARIQDRGLGPVVDLVDRDREADRDRDAGEPPRPAAIEAAPTSDRIPRQSCAVAEMPLATVDAGRPVAVDPRLDVGRDPVLARRRRRR